LRYRKVDQFLLNFLLGEESGITAPVTEVARATAAVEVASPRRAAKADDPGVVRASRRSAP